NRLADLAHGRGIAALLHRVADHLENLALPRCEAERVASAHRQIDWNAGVLLSHEPSSRDGRAAGSRGHLSIRVLRVAQSNRTSIEDHLQTVVRESWNSSVPWCTTSYGSSIDIVFDFSIFRPACSRVFGLASRQPWCLPGG